MIMTKEEHNEMMREHYWNLVETSVYTNSKIKGWLFDNHECLSYTSKAKTKEEAVKEIYSRLLEDVGY